MSGGIGQTPASTGADEELRQYEPAYSAPPENPEYYMLREKQGGRSLTGLQINNYMIPNLERDTQLCRERKRAYVADYPDDGWKIEDMPDPLYFRHGVLLSESGMPRSTVYKKDVPPKRPIELLVLSIGSGSADVYTVSEEWKDIIEEEAPGECQFFAHEYLHKDGSLIRTRYIIRCLAPGNVPIFSPRKSGFIRSRWTSGPRTGEYYWDIESSTTLPKKLYAGQLVVCRSAIAGWNIIYRESEYFVSARLYERLKAHCGRHYAFYPLHIDEEC